MKEYKSAWSAISLRFAAIFSFSILGWLIAELIFEELTRIHFAVIAVVAIILSPKYSSYTQNSGRIHCLKWWGFKYFSSSTTNHN